MWNNHDTSHQFGESNEGGFMPDMTVTESQSEEGAKRASSITPFLAGHINKVPLAELTILGLEVRLVTIVGIVRDVVETSTKISYKIEDETGTVDVELWLEENARANHVLQKLNTYVRVFGIIKEKSGKQVIVLLKIWPLKSLNDLTTHLLEVTDIFTQDESTEDIYPESSNVVSSPAEGQELLGVSAEQNIVFKIIKRHNHSENGISKDAIKRELPSHLVSRLDEIIEFLSSEGHIYTTCTDDNYKTT